MEQIHPLLRCHVERHFGSLETIPQEWQGFIETVNHTYKQFDAERQVLEDDVEARSQELMQVNSQLWSATPSLFLRLNLSGTILDCKKGDGEDLYLSLANPIGKRLQDCLPNPIGNQFDAALCQVQQTKPIISLEHSLTRSGQEYFYEARLLRLPEHQAIVIIRDITERRQTEAALRKSEAQLRQQTQQLEQTLAVLQKAQTQLVQTEKMSSLGQLVAGIAHEINNPVNFISGNLPYLNQYVQDLVGLVKLYQQHYPNPVPEIVAEAQAIELDFLLRDLPQLETSIETGAERIRQIVVSLKSFSRLDESEMKEVDIHEGIESTLSLLQNRLKGTVTQPGIQLIKQYGPLPLVKCYAGRLNQVFMNLLVNAIDALEERNRQLCTKEIQDNPGTIAIYTEVSRDNTQIVVRILDNGLGIEPEMQARLFDPFFTTKPVGKGTGLGLSISYQIVSEQHHGSLMCFSTPGEGTEFWVEIPIQPPIKR